MTASPLSSEDPTFVDRAPPRVLVVDDDEAIRRALVRILSRWGYLVITASSVEEALQHARASRPHLMIVDRELRGEDGAALLPLLREELEELAPPVLFCTGRMTGPPPGAAGIVRKPFRVRELVQRVHDLTRRSTTTLALSRPDTTTRA